MLRNVAFHFDDTTDEGLRLWERQDRLMRGDLDRSIDDSVQ